MSRKDKKANSDQEKDLSDFKGFNIKINEFGEVICSHTMDDINEFLDVNVEDKKLKSKESDPS